MFDFYLILWIIAGYLIGSICWSIVIGKVFFHKDVRDFGSGNPGGTNAGRAFGLPVGIAVILLDAFKAFLMMLICHFLYEKATIACGFAALIGHCYPVYYKFKGGKGVSTAYGFILGLCVFDQADVIFSLVYPLLILILLLGLFKMMSVASMTSLLSSLIITSITSDNNTHKILLLVIVILVVYRHRENIRRIIQGKESKLKFIK